MKKYIIFLIALLLNLTSCQNQDTKEGNVTIKKSDKKEIEQPKGSWKVDKEFDENGNLIRYDSIYSWSSDEKWNNISLINKDSLLKSFKSKFYHHFSHFKDDGFDDLFTEDSLFEKQFFSNNFFESEFAKDFMDIDWITRQMVAKQKKFLEKYQSKFKESEKQ